MGWGVLLWGTDDPPLPPGTVLRVVFRSAITNTWVAEVPQEFRVMNGADKVEIPLAHLEFTGSRRRARARVREFGELAVVYAETLQDGLPIRNEPENGSRRVYRLRQGEVVKVLSRAAGVAAVGVSGAPLPGEWFRVLTEGGVEGYCFSYRLKLFEHTAGALSARWMEEQEEDTELDALLGKRWAPESYGEMLESERFDFKELSKGYLFDPGADTGTAWVFTADVDRTFSYTGIRRTGARAWSFTGASLQMSLLSDTALEVRFDDGSAPSGERALRFTALPQDVRGIIVQETARREELFDRLFALGPEFESAAYGRLVLTGDGRFVWTGTDLLVPHIIPEGARESGAVDMGLYPGPALRGRYTGGLILRFNGAFNPAGPPPVFPVRFLYTVVDGGLELEYVPPENITGSTVTRRAPAPAVVYFTKALPRSAGESAPERALPEE
jgi:hypothetical protein